jgi:competence protein ComFC
MKKLLQRIISLIFPAACLVCRRDLAPKDRPGLCGNCRASIKKIPPPFCRRCGLPLPDGGTHCRHCRRKEGRALKKLRSAALYESPLKDALKKFKYHKKTYLANALGELLHQTALENPEFLDCAHVVPVPMHIGKKRQRGYNQAELLARELCQKTGQKLEVHWLSCAGTRHSQTELSREERIKNVAGAFRVKTPKIDARGDALLIDDVCTTGATLEECAKALKAAGCRRIFALTLAREARSRSA